MRRTQCGGTVRGMCSEQGRQATQRNAVERPVLSTGVLQTQAYLSSSDEELESSSSSSLDSSTSLSVWGCRCVASMGFISLCVCVCACVRVCVCAVCGACMCVRACCFDKQASKALPAHHWRAVACLVRGDRQEQLPTDLHLGRVCYGAIFLVACSCLGGLTSLAFSVSTLDHGGGR